jgi:hypothetical protein
MLEALRSDHRAITAMLDDPAASSASDEAKTAREQLVMNLVRHFVAEEQYLYPVVRRYVPDGDALAESGFTRDRSCEHQLRRLEEPHPTTESISTVWTDIRAAFTAHVKDQESLFSTLATTCSAAQLAELGEGVLGAEQLAPTRPRPVALESPSANRVLSLVEGFVDRVRDAYTHRGLLESEDRTD